MSSHSPLLLLILRLFLFRYRSRITQLTQIPQMFPVQVKVITDYTDSADVSVQVKVITDYTDSADVAVQVKVTVKVAV